MNNKARVNNLSQVEERRLTRGLDAEGLARYQQAYKVEVTLASVSDMNENFRPEEGRQALRLSFGRFDLGDSRENAPDEFNPRELVEARMRTAARHLHAAGYGDRLAAAMPVKQGGSSLRRKSIAERVLFVAGNSADELIGAVNVLESKEVKFSQPVATIRDVIRASVAARGKAV